MDNNFEQIILYDMPIKNYYSLDQLNEKIIPTSETVKKYEKIPREDRFYRDTKENEDEKWKLCPERIEIEVSNFGRIKIDGKIWAQKEENYTNRKWYLKLDNISKVPREYIEYLKTFRYTYNLVATIWLARYIEDESVWDVHHITNEGYDNRPENLIWMKRHDHNKVIHKTRL